MSLVPSLLQAIVRVDGEALVMHVGDKPYVVSPIGQVDLATRGLTLDAVSGIVNQLLPLESQRALDEFGAVQFELPSIPEFPGEHFTVVVARGGDDVWAEIRRRRIQDDDRVPMEVFGTPPGRGAGGHPAVHHSASASELGAVRNLIHIPSSEPVVHAAGPLEATDSDDLMLPDAEQLWPGQGASREGNGDTDETESTPAQPLVGMPAAGPRPPVRRQPYVVSSPEHPVDQPRPLTHSELPQSPITPPVVLPTAAPDRRVQVSPPPATIVPPTLTAGPHAAPPIPARHSSLPPEPSAPPPPERFASARPEGSTPPMPERFASAPPGAVASPPSERFASAQPEAVAPPPPERFVSAPPEAVALPPPERFASARPEAVAPPPPERFVSAPPKAFAPTPPGVPASVPPGASAPGPPEAFAPPPPATFVPPSITAFPPTPPGITASVPTGVSLPEPPEVFVPSPPGVFVPPPAAVFAHSAPPSSPFGSPPQQAVVLPMARNPIRSDVPPPRAEQALADLDRLLRLAAARGASTLYLSSASRPSVRVDGEVQTLDGEPVLGPNDVESLLLTLMPERNAEALRTGGASEWICDLPEVGRVRCMSFRDHRGTGGVFRMMPVRAVTAEQLGLSREIQSLAIEPEGLVLVAGPRSSGKRTLLSALVDLINRVRRDYVITIEKEINVVHERIGSFISQREVHGGSDELLAVARAALREDPDVLVLEELRSAALMNVALDAASSGQLVIGGLPAPNATGAIDRIIDLYPPEYRRQVQLSLSQNLRGVVSQVLLRKTGGGRLAAREVLINTPAVRSILAEGKTSQLPLAIEGGRAHGMVPLNDWLVGYVQGGVVDVREAHRRAVDRTGFLALLKRQGVDTSALERLG